MVVHRIRKAINNLEESMSKQPHHNVGAESMSGANSGRRTGAEPRLQNGAGMSRKKANAGMKKSATKPQHKKAA
jgi:hypothetical protein